MFKHAQRNQNNKSAIPFLGMTGWIVMIYDLVKLGLNLDFVVRVTKPALFLREMIHYLLVFILSYFILSFEATDLDQSHYRIS